MAVHTELLINYAQQWRDAGHGAKGAVLDQACASLGLARATLHRKFKSLIMTSKRKRRSDAGTTSLDREEAKIILAVVLEHMRKNAKRIKSFSSAVEECRECGLIKAERVHPVSGEVFLLSTSAIVKALRLYHMHPEQVLRPAPAISMASLHPNHVWQIDASRCIMFFLPTVSGDNGLRIEAEAKAKGLEFAEPSKYYKNKPANQIKQIRASLWRYVVTDHRSGWVYVDYVTRGETSENLIHAFMGAMVRRDGEAMHGVPRMIMLDPGSANTSKPFENLCNALQIRIQVNAVGQPRAKGQVEKGQDLVERGFESMLKTLPVERVQTLEQIRELAARWRRRFNGREVMRRHGMTRDQAWLHIASDELIVAPAADLMAEVANSAPESRTVSDQMTVSFQGHEYDVSHVPAVANGDKLMICRNVMATDSAQAIVIGADGHDEFHVLPEVRRDDFGQVVGAPIIGESYARHADTPAQTAAKEVELLATGAASLEEAAALRKAKKHHFLGGRYDPLVLMSQPVPAHLPRAGTEHAMTHKASQVVLAPLTHIQAAKSLRARIDSWGKKHYEWLVANYPDGVPADDLDAVEAALRAGTAPQIHSITRVA